MIQIEYAGTVINSRPCENVMDPYFAELFIFPVSEESSYQLPDVMATKVFITVFLIEGKNDVPDPVTDSIEAEEERENFGSKD